MSNDWDVCDAIRELFTALGCTGRRTRRGNGTYMLDLITRVAVSYADAALGTKVPLQMLDDTSFDVDVPAGTQPGAVLTFKGKGAPRVDGRSGRGALHVVVEVRVPKKLSARAKTLLAELDEELREPQGKRATAG
jgi:molecular chaperone DnaJ